jgi:DNA invertase Pin-like site-specific DNA recombinase
VPTDRYGSKIKFGQQFLRIVEIEPGMSYLYVMTNASTHAIAYLRTSSATNVDGDSSARQRVAIENYAAANGLKIVAEFYDAAVSGADPVEQRPGFSAMLDRIEGNGVRLVIVEDASRFARALTAQELGVLLMQQRGVRVVTAGGDDLTNSDDPARVMFRQIAGAFAQYEKARLVAKLQGARARKATERGYYVGGRKRDSARWDALRELRVADPKATYATLSARLAERGIFTLTKDGGSTGKALSATEIGRMMAKLEKAA